MNTQKPPHPETESSGTTLKPFVWLCACVIGVWILISLVIGISFDDWETRGTVGDMFGAVNALYSGLALAGVIYALLLQRTELRLQREELGMTRAVMKSQLAEMRSARELQSQPLALPSIDYVRVERPRLFYTPPEDAYNAMARYFVALPIRNPTNFPCVGLNVRAAILVQRPNQEATVLSATDVYIECLPPQTHTQASERPEFMFATDPQCHLFDAVRQADPRRLPALVVIMLYKNIAGAHFRVSQMFRIGNSGTSSSIIRDWHTALAGFGPAFSQNIDDLRMAKARRPQEWDELFDRTKESFDRTLANDESDVTLISYAVPASFDIQQISAEEYQAELNTAAYAQILSVGQHCPAEIDARAKSP